MPEYTVNTEPSGEERLPAARQKIMETLAENGLHRGAMAILQAQVSELDRSVMQSRLEHPFSYSYGDILETGDGFRYRTGRGEKQMYMTLEDLMRLRRDRFSGRFSCSLEAFQLEADRREENAIAMRRPACAFRSAECTVAGGLSDRVPVFFGDVEADAAVRNRDSERPGWKERLQRLMGNTGAVSAGFQWRSVQKAVAGLSMVAVFALVVALPITMNVLIHRETAQISALDRKIAAAEAEVVQKEIELDRKNDRAVLEDLAVNRYGMVRLDNRQYTVLQLHPGDSIEAMEKEKQGGAVVALLNALGLRSED